MLFVSLCKRVHSDWCFHCSNRHEIQPLSYKGSVSFNQSKSGFYDRKLNFLLPFRDKLILDCNLNNPRQVHLSFTDQWKHGYPRTVFYIDLWLYIFDKLYFNMFSYYIAVFIRIFCNSSLLFPVIVTRCSLIRLTIIFVTLLCSF